jgi:spermidine synthase
MKCEHSSSRLALHQARLDPGFPDKRTPGKVSRAHWMGVVATLLIAAESLTSVSSGAVIFDTTSAYHNIRVVDEAGFRTLCFDDATETRMSLRDPLQGHCEYTEYFHMAWLWNNEITNVLMIGLGGGSTQRSFEHYYPWVKIQTIEIDPVVLQVAKTYFTLRESERQKVQIEDGRMFLRRSAVQQDLIILDAYVQGRYGAGIPQHLATKEFFELVRDHLTPNGVLAYNVIGTVSDWHADIVGAVYRTLRSVFPEVYLFPARSSRNVVIIATRAAGHAGLSDLRQRALNLVQTRRAALSGIRERVESFYPATPANAARSPILTDDYAPVEGLAGAGGTALR